MTRSPEGDGQAGGSGPRPVADSLDRLARELGLGDPRAAARVEDQWEEIVGEEAARHLRPARLRAGVLRVEADDPSWATRARYMAPDVVRGVNAVLGAEVVDDVRVVVRPAAS